MLPLSGLKVVELHAIGPVPFAGRLLADLGAQVTRVSPPRDAGLGIALPERFDVLNQRKTRLALDMKATEGSAAARALVDGADVLLEGFRPGVLERLGLGPAALLESNPRLVVGRLSGWGSDGPYAARAGHDINYLGLAGVLHAIGERDAPVPPLNLVADFGGGAMHLLVGVLALLVRRGIDGRGGTVDTSILAGTHGLTGMFHGMVAGGAWSLSRADNLLDGAPPFYRCYRAACGGHVSAGALEPKFYAELVDVLGLAGRIDLARQYDRDTWEATAQAFAQAVATRSRDEWARLAETRDACMAPVLDFTEAAAHPHNRANHWFGDDTLGAQDVLRFN